MVYISFFESDTIYISVKLVRIHEPWNFGYPKNREKIDWKQVENEKKKKKLVQLSSNSCFSADCGFLLVIPENQISDTYSTTNLYTVPSSIKFGSLKKLDLITYYSKQFFQSKITRENLKFHLIVQEEELATE